MSNAESPAMTGESLASLLFQEQGHLVWKSRKSVPIGFVGQLAECGGMRIQPSIPVKIIGYASGSDIAWQRTRMEALLVGNFGWTNDGWIFYRVEAAD